ncbi:MAG: MOSC domain-containing protein [Chloroflexota bacterium]
MTYSRLMAHKTREQLEAGLTNVLAAPADHGSVRLIVRRPEVDVREVVPEGRLDPVHGLVGDDWENRPGHNGGPERYAQVTLMNARYTELIADSAEPEQWAIAGDQLYVDMDISQQNLPAGTRLSMGSATIEISEEPHTGCAKFSARFGSEAWKFANTPSGRSLRLRGANAMVVEAGDVGTGDTITRA